MTVLLQKAKELIKGGFFHILSGNILNKAISMISSIVIARLIDKSEYAYLSYADNLYSYLALMSGLGLSSALLKYCVADNSSDNKAYIKYAVSRGTAFDLLTSLILCTVVSFVNIPYPRARIYIWALCLYTPITNIYTSLTCYVRTQYENKKYAIAGIIYSSVVCVLSVLLLLVINIAGIVVARYISVFAALLYLFIYVRKKLKNSDDCKLDKSKRVAFRNMGISLMLANMFSGMMPVNETFLVNEIIRDEVTTANFKVAGLFPQMLLLVAGAVTVYYFPIIAQMKDWKAIRRKVYIIGIFNFIFILTLAIIGAILTPLALKILYGNKYIDAIPITYLLWGMRAMNCCFRMVPINMLPAIGKTKFNAWVAAGSCLFQVVIDYSFISKFGITGVAWGAIIVYAISGLMYWLYFDYVCRKKIKEGKAYDEL